MKIKFYHGLVLVFCLHFIQAFFTSVNADEAYYLLYGQNLSWGYFDHPPFVGLLTYLSSLLFDSTMGIRFFTVILHPFTLWFIWNTIDKEHIKTDQTLVYLFFILASSLVMFTVYGFITTPDVGLLFFASMFLWSYKSFLKEEKWTNTLWMGIAMAGMMYSKYHGALLIIIVLLSHNSLIRSFKFWISAILALSLWTPHILWQIDHNFPSLTYHLISRSRSFKWEYIYMYPVNQFLIYNPAIWIIGMKILWKRPPGGMVFQRTLYHILWGFLSFFAVTSLRGHVEPHWTVIISLPVMILLCEAGLRDKVHMNKMTTYIGFSLILVFAARILLLTDVISMSNPEKYISIHEVSGEAPVIFTGSFQNPSLYSYYTNTPSSVVSSVDSRYTQFDILKKDTAWWDKKVFVYGHYENLSDTFYSEQQMIEGFWVEKYQPPHYLKAALKSKLSEMAKNERHCQEFILKNPLSLTYKFDHPDMPAKLNMIVFDKKTKIILPLEIENSPAAIEGKEEILLKGCYQIPDLPEGSYKMALCIKSVLGDHIISGVTPFIIKHPDIHQTH